MYKYYKNRQKNCAYCQNVFYERIYNKKEQICIFQGIKKIYFINIKYIIRQKRYKILSMNLKRNIWLGQGSLYERSEESV